MKAVILHGPDNYPNNYEVMDIPKPVCGDEEILLHMRAAALCGTDKRIFTGAKTKGVRKDSVVGHEICGEIAEVGKNVQGFSVGGAMTLPPSAAAVPVDVKLTKAWWTLPVKGKVRFFSGASPRDLGVQTASQGGCSFGNADSNGAALFTSENSDVMPGMTLFVKKGERIEIPRGANLPDGTTVRCRFYKIGVE